MTDQQRRFVRDPRCAGRVIDGRAALVTAHDNRLHLLNATGTTIWRCVERECTVDDLVRAVVDEFEIDPVTARADVEAFCRDLLARRVLAERTAAAVPVSDQR